METEFDAQLTLDIELNQGLTARVVRGVTLALSFNADRTVFQLRSGWPTLTADDSQPLQPATTTVQISLASSGTGTMDEDGILTLPIVLHLDYQPDYILGVRDQDVALTLATGNLIRALEQVPDADLSGNATYYTREWFLAVAVPHSLSVRLEGQFSPPPAPYPPDELVWFDGALPVGARPTVQNELTPWAFNLIAGTLTQPPAPPGYGTSRHSHAVKLHYSSPTAPGVTQHFFEAAQRGLSVVAGDQLFAYVYIDSSISSQGVVEEIMLQWNDGSWEHRAFWGDDRVPWGASGSASRRRMGDLPAPRTWVRLTAPASDLGLEGRTVNGMAFTLSSHGGPWVSWGRAGVVRGQPRTLLTSVQPYPVTIGRQISVTVSVVDSVTGAAVRNATLSLRDPGKSAVVCPVGPPFPYTFKMVTHRVKHFDADTGQTNWEVTQACTTGQVSAPGYPSADVDFGMP